MSSTHSFNTSDWDAGHLLAITIPDQHCTCIGYAPSKKRGCCNRVAAHNAKAAKVIMKDLPKLSKDPEQLQSSLLKLAGLILCQRYHQDQAQAVAQRWYGVISKKLRTRRHSHEESQEPIDASNSESQISKDHSCYQHRILELEAQLIADSERHAGALRQAEQDRAVQLATTQRNHEWEQALQKREAEYQTSCRSQQETASRMQQQQEALDQALTKLQQENASSRQRVLDREARFEAFLKVEREATDRREDGLLRASRTAGKEVATVVQPTQEPEMARQPGQQESAGWTWATAWARYERDWTATVPDGIPWPVQDGKCSNVTKKQVRDFFENAPDILLRDKRAFIRLLRRQVARWVPERIVVSFPNAQEDAGAVASVKLVRDVIDSLLAVAKEEK